MLRLLKHYAENDKTHKIKTVRCDTSYPWPAGKAPWSVEMGGNGIPPQPKRRRSNSDASGKFKCKGCVDVESRSAINATACAGQVPETEERRRSGEDVGHREAHDGEGGQLR